MIRLPRKNRAGPIGIDLGSSAIKLVQLSHDRSRLLDFGRWDLPSGDDGTVEPERRDEQLADAIRRIRTGRNFRGRDAILCLNDQELFVQNIRLAKQPNVDLDRQVQQEVAGRIPFPVAEAEIRYVEAGDVRQGDSIMREVIVFACHRPSLDHLLAVVEESGLRPLSVDVEPCAILRSYFSQYRREEDQNSRVIFVHVGYSRTAVVIAQGDHPLFVKYIDFGGRHMDQAVARHLNMEMTEASALRRHNGDRRMEHQDQEVCRSVSEAVRPVTENLLTEIALCIRYHSVTFRGNPLTRLVLGGGEATSPLLDALSSRIDLRCELGDPLRSLASSPHIGRKGQWDVAAGLAMRETTDGKFA